MFPSFSFLFFSALAFGPNMRVLSSPKRQRYVLEHHPTASGSSSTPKPPISSLARVEEDDQTGDDDAWLADFEARALWQLGGSDTRFADAIDQPPYPRILVTSDAGDDNEASDDEEAVDDDDPLALALLTAMAHLGLRHEPSASRRSPSPASPRVIASAGASRP